MLAGRPAGKGGKRARDESDTHQTRDVRARGRPNLSQLPHAWWRGDIDTDRAGNLRYWHHYLGIWLYIDDEDGEYYWGWSKNKRGHNKIVVMTWAIDRFSGRTIRQLAPNFYRPDCDPNEGWS